MFWRRDWISFVSSHQLPMSAVIAEQMETQHSEATSTFRATLDSQMSIKVRPGKNPMSVTTKTQKCRMSSVQEIGHIESNCVSKLKTENGKSRSTYN